MGSENSHKSDCGEVLDEVYLYLDLECDEQRRDLIRTHLDECSPCLREFGLEEAVKRLVHKSCGSEPAPADLRHKVLTRIEAVRVELEVTQFRVE